MGSFLSIMLLPVHFLVVWTSIGPNLSFKNINTLTIALPVFREGAQSILVIPNWISK